MTRSLGLRIMMTTDAVGGVWTYATALSAALADRGADVTLVTMGPAPRPDQRSMVHDKVDVIETDLALEWQDPEAEDIGRARRKLRELETQLRPHVIHLNSYREATFGWIAPVIVAAHSCVNSWGRACNDSEWLREPRWRRYSELVAAGLDAATAWVCPSAAHRAAVDEIYHPSRAGAVIWNGIAAALQPEPKHNVILAAGRMWDKAKGLSTLVETANNEAADNQPGDEVRWPILVAGEAGQHEAGSIQFLGDLPQADLHRLMRRAAIFASPALYEPFGLAVLEAASARCALVLSDIPSFRELWDHAALFVPPGDSDQLGAAFDPLIQDETLRLDLQSAALTRAKTYSLTRMVDGYQQLYSALRGAAACGPRSMGAVA
ncbi:putative glycosyltransferase protein [Bradyrhizobium sp. STM 3843]|uniref:glycosyltransferase family 4 protein n=1 Tax=Bradyrhizobium sp. STM 3843 TaxID=551947 RepID=UPI00024032A1|nr:glycosyltransferase family 4 protein [Bradyrhizobium sp. STM 3843]CCE11296.1 putative glycosyltransferase protein [Bradyrhizobium sp. STM 3843]